MAHELIGKNVIINRSGSTVGPQEYIVLDISDGLMKLHDVKSKQEFWVSTSFMIHIKLKP